MRKEECLRLWQKKRECWKAARLTIFSTSTGEVAQVLAQHGHLQQTGVYILKENKEIAGHHTA